MKRFITLFLCLVLTVCAFTACTKRDKQTEEPAASAIKITADSAYSTYDSVTFNAYESVCNAVLKGESFARLNTGLLEQVRRLVNTSFPLYPLIKSMTAKEDGSGVVLEYTQEREAHLKSVAAFEAKITEITEACKGENTGVYAVNVYRYVASHIQKSDDAAVTCYDTVINGKGSVYSYAQLLTYLLLQGGVSACYVTASDAGNVGWGLCEVALDGNWYYLDAMTEYYDNGGEKLLYFGMTEKDLNAEGLQQPSFSDSATPYDASSLYFDACRLCNSYEIQGTELLVHTTEGNIVHIQL